MRLTVLVPIVWLIAIHVAVVGAEFLAPYDHTAQNRSMPFTPPMHPHFEDAEGRFSLRPFVCHWAAQRGNAFTYTEDCGRRYQVHFLTRNGDSGLRLFGVDKPGVIYLLGTDEYGRDQLSRFLHGGRISLFAGILACAISLVLALVLGSTAGFYGRWIDDSIMAVAELFLALPWLYLLFAVRAFLPLDTPPATAFLLVIGLVGLIGWARPARLIRGLVLSARERPYVLAARGFGASDLYLMRRHILPQIRGLLFTQAALLIPRYTLAEVTLSFLGLGVNEPAASWGSMLAILQQYHVLVSYWWMFLPAIFLVPTFFSYLSLSTMSLEAKTEYLIKRD